jgi:hypothetical protein
MQSDQQLKKIEQNQLQFAENEEFKEEIEMGKDENIYMKKNIITEEGDHDGTDHNRGIINKLNNQGHRSSANNITIHNNNYSNNDATAGRIMLTENYLLNDHRAGNNSALNVTGSINIHPFTGNQIIGKESLGLLPSEAFKQNYNSTPTVKNEGKKKNTTKDAESLSFNTSKCENLLSNMEDDKLIMADNKLNTFVIGKKNANKFEEIFNTNSNNSIDFVNTKNYTQMVTITEGIAVNKTQNNNINGDNKTTENNKIFDQEKRKSVVNNLIESLFGENDKNNQIYQSNNNFINHIKSHTKTNENFYATEDDHLSLSLSLENSKLEELNLIDSPVKSNRKTPRDSIQDNNQFFQQLKEDDQIFIENNFLSHREKVENLIRKTVSSKFIKKQPGHGEERFGNMKRTKTEQNENNYKKLRNSITKENISKHEDSFMERFKNNPERKISESSILNDSKRYTINVSHGSRSARNNSASSFISRKESQNLLKAKSSFDSS